MAEITRTKVVNNLRPLLEEIIADATLGPKFVHLSHYRSSDNELVIDFNPALTAPEIVIYDALLAAYADPVFIAKGIYLAKLRHSGTDDVNGLATDNIVPWDIEDKKDSVFIHDTVTDNSRIKVLATGTYIAKGGIVVESGSRYNGFVKLRINGNTSLPERFCTGYARGSAGQDNTTLTFDFMVDLVENDYFEILVDRESTSSAANMVANMSSLQLTALVA